MSFNANWYIKVSNPYKLSEEQIEALQDRLDNDGWLNGESFEVISAKSEEPPTLSVAVTGSIFGGKDFKECHELVTNAVREVLPTAEVKTFWKYNDGWDAEFDTEGG